MNQEPHANNPTPELGGKLVANSSVFLPPTAAAGAIVRGRAPAGSTIEFQGQEIEVGKDGAFSIQIPANAQGRTSVRILRPAGQTPVTLQIDVAQR